MHLRALFRNHMEGTDFDKHFKGYQPQLVVESAEIEAEEMLAAGSEADD